MPGSSETPQKDLEQLCSELETFSSFLHEGKGWVHIKCADIIWKIILNLASWFGLLEGFLNPERIHHLVKLHRKFSERERRLTVSKIALLYKPTVTDVDICWFLPSVTLINSQNLVTAIV